MIDVRVAVARIVSAVNITTTGRNRLPRTSCSHITFRSMATTMTITDEDEEDEEE